jgi:hypothetical protein
MANARKIKPEIEAKGDGIDLNTGNKQAANDDFEIEGATGDGASIKNNVVSLKFKLPPMAQRLYSGENNRTGERTPPLATQKNSTNNDELQTPPTTSPGAPANDNEENENPESEKKPDTADEENADKNEVKSPPTSNANNTDDSLGKGDLPSGIVNNDDLEASKEPKKLSDEEQQRAADKQEQTRQRRNNLADNLNNSLGGSLGGAMGLMNRKKIKELENKKSKLEKEKEENLAEIKKLRPPDLVDMLFSWLSRIILDFFTWGIFEEFRAGRKFVYPEYDEKAKIIKLATLKDRNAGIEKEIEKLNTEKYNLQNIFKRQARPDAQPAATPNAA